jgi:hypothetical protein
MVMLLLIEPPLGLISKSNLIAVLVVIDGVVVALLQFHPHIVATRSFSDVDPSGILVEDGHARGLIKSQFGIGLFTIQISFGLSDQVLHALIQCVKQEVACQWIKVQISLPAIRFALCQVVLLNSSNTRKSRSRMLATPVICPCSFPRTVSVVV